MSAPDLVIAPHRVTAGVGARLREERKRLGMSQTKFAAAIGVHPNTQSRYEKDERSPDTAYLRAVANAGVDVAYVLTGTNGAAPAEQGSGTPEQIADAALVIGNRRSAEYRCGMLDVLRYRLEGVPIRCPYQEGSVQFDAYFAGNDRGHHVWRAMVGGAGKP